MPVSSQKSNRESLLKYAANILSRRPYFRHTLKEKLFLRSKKLKLNDVSLVIDSILDDLAGSGYLDDKYLAEAYVRRQLAKGYGPRLISLRLGALHLDRDLINQAIDNEATPENQYLAIKKFSAKYARLDPRKIISKLYARGFASRVISMLFDGTAIED
jgi:SOS response regulatory protein OraA/RecX